MRRIALALCVVSTVFAVLGVGTAAADPVKNPTALVFTVTCDGLGTFDVVATGPVGHLFGNTGIGVLVEGTIRTFRNGIQIDQVTEAHPGQGISTVSCSAFSQFAAGPDTIRIEITDARIHLTPARR